MILYKKAQEGTYMTNKSMIPKEYTLQSVEDTSLPGFRMPMRAPVSQPQRNVQVSRPQPTMGIITTPQDYDRFPMIAKDRNNMKRYTDRFNEERKAGENNLKSILGKTTDRNERIQLRDDISNYQNNTESLRNWLNTKNAKQLQTYNDNL